MNILFFSPYFYPYISGFTVYPYRILEHLKKNHKITVLTFSPAENDLTKDGALDGMQIIRMPFLFKFSKGYISITSIFTFHDEIQKCDSLFINLPNIEGVFLTILGRLFHKKIVALFHCRVSLPFSIVNKLMEVCLEALTILQMQLSTGVVAYKDYTDSLSLPVSIRSKVHNCLPPIPDTVENINKTKELLIMKKNTKWVGFAGRLAREKGIEYLIDAIKNVDNVKLVFAGPYAKQVSGENAYYDFIIGLLKKNKISYQFLGNLSSSELVSFYKIIDVLVLPSINQTEAFGMVQVEAMLTGTPVVASNLPGVRVPIKLTKMGILVKPKNADELRRAITTVLHDRNKYGNKILTDKAIKIFDINIVYRFYEKLIC